MTDPDAHRPPSDAASTALDVVRVHLQSAGVTFTEPAPGTFAVSLPGVHKLNTVASLVVGAHSLTINAFVVRHPDENAAGLHKWLLERNRRLNAVSYAIDQFGDVYLVGRLPNEAVTGKAVDAILGAVLEYADGDFNTMLEIGFATSIRKEWQWRLSRGESTANLTAFRHLADPGSPAAGDPAD